MRILVLGAICSGLWLGAVAGAAGLPWSLPVVNGTLTGKVRLSAQSPELVWRMTAQPEAAGRLSLDASLDGPGTRVHARAAVSSATGEGEWQIEEGRVDLASWLAAAADKMPRLAGWRAAGTLAVTGRGTLRSGALDGTLTLALAGGSLHNEAKKISCDGISLRLVLAGLQPLRADKGQELSMNTLNIAGTEVRNLKFFFALAPGGNVRVDAAEVAGFGGRISAEPFVFDPAQRQFTFTGRAFNLDLAQICAAVDSGRQRIREAAGRVSGQVTLHVDAGGVRFGPGALVMPQGETARVLFQPTPGLFTTYSPPLVLKVCPGFNAIELGRLPLVMKKFSIRFYPDGEQADRSALIQLEGNSSDPHFPAPISEDININGSLQEGVHLFLNFNKMWER